METHVDGQWQRREGDVGVRWKGLGKRVVHSGAQGGREGLPATDEVAETWRHRGGVAMVTLCG